MTNFVGLSCSCKKDKSKNMVLVFEYNSKHINNPVSAVQQASMEGSLGFLLLILSMLCHRNGMANNDGKMKHQENSVMF